MSKVYDKYFNFTGGSSLLYDRMNKEQNVNNHIAYMLDKSNLMFKWHNLPKSIPQEELEKLLQMNGFAIICKIDGELYAVNGGLGGELDVYNRPTEAIVSVPYLNYNANLKIGKECVIIKNDTMGMGLIPMLSKYCYMLNETDVTMLMKLINTRIQTVMSATDETTLQSARKFLEGIENGKLGEIVTEDFSDNFKVNNIGTINNPFKDLIELSQYIKGSMLNELGLNHNFNMKRERLNTAEIEMNSDNLYPFVDDMRRERLKAIEELKEVFDIDIEIEFSSSWDYRINEGKEIPNIENKVSDDEVIEGSDDEVIEEQEVPKEEQEEQEQEVPKDDEDKEGE